MDWSHFGQDTGRKFHANGDVREFPGNTVISLLEPDSAVYREICDWQERMRASAAEPAVTLLPASSLHMTAIEGVCDQVRDSAHWTRLLPTDAPLEQVHAFFAEQFQRIDPLPPVHMRFDQLEIHGGVTMHLFPVNSSDAEALRLWRDQASEALGVRFPNHDVYQYHISLAYGRPQPSAQAKEALLRLKQESADRYQSAPFSFSLPQPQLVFFHNMLAFLPLRPRQTIQN